LLSPGHQEGSGSGTPKAIRPPMRLRAGKAQKKMVSAADRHALPLLTAPTKGLFHVWQVHTTTFRMAERLFRRVSAQKRQLNTRHYPNGHRKAQRAGIEAAKAEDARCLEPVYQPPPLPRPNLHHPDIDREKGAGVFRPLVTGSLKGQAHRSNPLRRIRAARKKRARL
jgi:hypothetical protein